MLLVSGLWCYFQEKISLHTKHLVTMICYLVRNKGSQFLLPEMDRWPSPSLTEVSRSTIPWTWRRTRQHFFLLKDHFLPPGRSGSSYLLTMSCRSLANLSASTCLASFPSPRMSSICLASWLILSRSLREISPDPRSAAWGYQRRRCMFF